MGIEVSVTAPLGATPADLARLGEADFNVVLYPEVGGQAASWLARTFGQKATRTIPIGIGATRDFVAEVAALAGVDPVEAPSNLPWYSRSVDSNYLTGKRVFVFGDATHAIAAARVAAEEFGFTVVGLGTYSREFAREVREAAKLYGVEPLITDDYGDVEVAVAAAQPELVLGTQMERHIAKRLGIACAVISAPVHVQDFPARYSPQMGVRGRQRAVRHLGPPADDGPGGTPARHVPRGQRVPRRGGTEPSRPRRRAAGAGARGGRPDPLGGGGGEGGRQDPVLRARQGKAQHGALRRESAGWRRSRWRRSMTRKPTMAAEPIRVVIVTMDSHLSSAAARAEAALQREIPGLQLCVHAADEWASDPALLAECHAAIAQGDIVIASMLFLEDHIRLVQPALAARRTQCDAMLCCMSAGEITRLTRLGRFDMAVEAKGVMAMLEAVCAAARASRAPRPGSRRCGCCAACRS